MSADADADAADHADAVTAVAPRWAAQRFVTIIENIPIARDTFRLRLDAPAVAQSILPGQFVMIRPGAEGADDPLLGRPFALYDIVQGAGGHAAAVDLVYLV